MKKKEVKLEGVNLSAVSMTQALGVVLYVALVVAVMSNMEHMAKEVPEYLLGMFMLLLFVVSAAVTGYLVLGRSIMMYWDGSKKEAVRLAMMTVGWLALVMVLIFIFLVIF